MLPTHHAPEWIRRSSARVARLRGRLHGLYAAMGVLLTCALALALVGLWGLSVLTEEVLEGETLRFDRAVLLWLDARATPGLDVAALHVTALGDTLVVVTTTAVAATLLALLGRRAYAALLALSVGGAWIMFPLLKLLFDRPRPRLFEWRAHYAGSSSYPSGHSVMSMVLLVALAYVVHHLAAERAWVRVATLLAAGTLILLVGLSRLYLGVHYPTDVLAGYVVGFAWAVFCALGVESLPRLRRRARDRDAPAGETHATGG